MRCMLRQLHLLGEEQRHGPFHWPSPAGLFIYKDGISTGHDMTLSLL